MSEEEEVRPSTVAWVSRHLRVGEHITGTVALHGGITADMRRLTITARDGSSRHLVLRSYTDRLSSRHTEGLLHTETFALKLLAGTGVSAPSLVAVDALADECEYPSLLMTHLPGRPVIGDEGVQTRVDLLARQLVSIHTLKVVDGLSRYRTGTSADTVVIPSGADAGTWAAAVDLIRRPAPTFEARTLHRDFQPGNVLFDVLPDSAQARISGVVDWAGICWGPTDLDVAHCSTNLALLHGPEWGLRFATAYEGSGGILATNTSDQRYWQVRDALASSEEVQLWAQPWREAGRTDLTRRVVEERLNTYLSILMSSHA